MKKFLCAIFSFLILFSSVIGTSELNCGAKIADYVMDDFSDFSADIKLYTANADDYNGYYRLEKGNFIHWKLYNISVLYKPTYPSDEYDFRIGANGRYVWYAYSIQKDAGEIEHIYYRTYRTAIFDKEEILKKYREKEDVTVEVINDTCIYIPEECKMIYQTHLNTKVELTVSESMNTKEQMLKMLDIELVRVDYWKSNANSQQLKKQDTLPAIPIYITVGILVMYSVAMTVLFLKERKSKKAQTQSSEES